MSLIPVAKSSKEGLLPVPIGTIYNWSQAGAYPKLITKVRGKLCWDTDEWELMMYRARDEQVAKAEALKG
jgi:hypothetical protein